MRDGRARAAGATPVGSRLHLVEQPVELHGRTVAAHSEGSDRAASSWSACLSRGGDLPGDPARARHDIRTDPLRVPGTTVAVERSESPDG
jgi:hypothetical protein